MTVIAIFRGVDCACVKINGETSEHFEIKVGLRQGCVMSPWLFNIYMDGVMREVVVVVVVVVAVVVVVVISRSRVITRN